jgi:hypothetical protein
LLQKIDNNQPHQQFSECKCSSQTIALSESTKPPDQTMKLAQSPGSPPRMTTGLTIRAEGERWSSDSKDGRYLQSLLETGAIEGLSGGQIQVAHPRFAKYDKNAFSTNVRRLKKKQKEQRERPANIHEGK